MPDEDENKPWLRGMNYVSRSLAEQWVNQKLAFYSIDPPGSPLYVSNADYHTSSWLTLAELSAAIAHSGLLMEDLCVEFKAMLAAMTSLSRSSDPHSVRLVFWFDN
jgi:hypothetical protein